MKLGLKQIILLFVIAFSSFAFKAELEQIKGWALRGSEPSSYLIDVEKDVERGGNVAVLKSIKPKIKDKFGTIMQTFSAEYYLGKKLKLSGYIKTKDIEEWVGMWMRVDGQKKHSLSFDNMGDRKIKGTTAWTKYEIILNVPKNSTTISYGVLLSGTGKVWLDDLTFEEVSEQITSTGKNLPVKPVNSSFEE